MQQKSSFSINLPSEMTFGIYPKHRKGAAMKKKAVKKPAKKGAKKSC